MRNVINFILVVVILALVYGYIAVRIAEGHRTNSQRVSLYIGSEQREA